MYNAIICKIKTRAHPDADRLQLGLAHGFQVVIGLDVQDGDLGIFFPSDGQLSQEMAEANNLVGYTDEDGKRKGGYFGSNRRVRAQKFRGEKSDGYWTELRDVSFTGYDITKLKEGDQLDSLNGVPLCNKYYTPATLKAISNGKNKIKKRVNGCFAEHMDTKQFLHEADRIAEGSLIYLTEKMHGTSGRFGFVADEWAEKKTLLERIKSPFSGKFKSMSGYRHLNGTRRVIRRDKAQDGFYECEDFRDEAITSLIGNLHKGEIVYFELVGYTNTGQSIMALHDTGVMKDKRFARQYGDKMNYKYGQVEGTCGLHVYRITNCNEDGVAIDLSWAQVKKRCEVLGVKAVSQYTDPFIYDGDKEGLMRVIRSFMEGASLYDLAHIREGVAIRIEGGHGVDFLKAKSHTFGMLEGYIKEQEDYVDLEEVS